MLQDVVGDLEQLGLGEVSDGALVVWLEGYKSRDGGAQPLLVRKSVGGFMYATTDLAAIRQRVGARDGGAGEGADRVLYVTDSGQSSHFDQVFQVAKRADFLPEGVSLEHVPFGLVQGEDGKKFKTRAGTTVKLKDLLDEAVSRTSLVVLVGAVGSIGSVESVVLTLRHTRSRSHVYVTPRHATPHHAGVPCHSPRPSIRPRTSPFAGLLGPHCQRGCQEPARGRRPTLRRAGGARRPHHRHRCCEIRRPLTQP